MAFTPAQELAILDAARVTIRRDLRDGCPQLPDLDDEIFSTPAGCFVTLHTLAEHRLRGCIGLIRGEKPLRDSLPEMAQAVLDDPRFHSDPVTLAELADLEIEVTILSPLILAANPFDFDLLEHGIYLAINGSSGCFLPQVARETGWTREQLLNRLCSEKMGLPPASWRDDTAKLYRFSSTIVGPQPFFK